VKGLKLRKARPGDRQAIFEFCKATWPGYGDYIPRVWREWIADAGGRLVVAELGGRPVGLGKVTRLGPGEIWLEGLRVDPRYRHRGIARAISFEVLRIVKRMGPGTVRFCTGVANRATRRMAEKQGFNVAARLRYYWQNSRRAGLRGDFAQARDISGVYDFIVNSRFLRLTRGLIGEGWVLREFSRDLLTDYVREKRVVILRKSHGIAGAAVYPFEENDRSLTLGFVDGDEASVRILTRNCMYLAKAQNLSYCSVAVPTRTYARLAEEAGYRRQDSVGQVVYELSIKGPKSLPLA